MTWIDTLLMGSLFVITVIILLVVIGSSIGPSSDAVLFWMSLVVVIGHTAYNVRLAMQANATELEKVRVCGCAGTSRDMNIGLNCRRPPSSVFVNFDIAPLAGQPRGALQGEGAVETDHAVAGREPGGVGGGCERAGWLHDMSALVSQRAHGKAGFGWPLCLP